MLFYDLYIFFIFTIAFILSSHHPKFIIIKNKNHEKKYAQSKNKKKNKKM